MKQYKKILAVLVMLTLLLCLMPTAALAASTAEEPAAEAEVEAAEAPAEEAVDEETEAAPAEEADAGEPAAEADGEAAEGAEDAEAAEETVEEAAEEAEAEEVVPVSVEAEDTFYAAAGDVVYNNGGTVYNNGGVVYNNGGLVYNNGGTVYNNGGTVYSNGGVVYNNVGTVYNNGAAIYTNGGDVEDSVIYGYYRVSMAGEYDAFAEIAGLETEPNGGDGLLVRQDAEVTITPKAGFTIVDAQASAGTLTAEEDGSYTLTEVDGKLLLTLRFQADAPEISLAEGTYSGEQKVELRAIDGAEIYFSTDGQAPTEENSQLYKEPITISEGMTLSAVAVVEGAEQSPVVTASYAIVSVAAPEFEAVEAGYKQPSAQALVITNSGSVDASIVSVELSGDNADCFALNHSSGSRVKAGDTDSSHYTLRPAPKLEAGSYKALVTVTFDSGESAQVEVVFQVNEPAPEEEAPAEEAAEADAEAAETEAPADKGEDNAGPKGGGKA